MKNVFLFFINFYKKYISQIFEYSGIRCKYYPTCSEYTKQAIQKYGTIKGSFLGLKRIEIDRKKFENARTVVDYVVENIDLEKTVNNIIELYN